MTKKLKIKIEGDRAGGKSTLVWLLEDFLVSKGFQVKVNNRECVAMSQARIDAIIEKNDIVEIEEII